MNQIASVKLAIHPVLAVLEAETITVLPACQAITFTGQPAWLIAAKENTEIIVITNARTVLPLAAKPVKHLTALVFALVVIKEAICNLLAIPVKQLAPLVFSETVSKECAQHVKVLAKSVSARALITVLAARLQHISMK